MPTTEIALHWLAVLFYVAGTSLYIIGVLWGKERYHRWGVWIATFGLIPHGIALGLRWSITGRIPSYGRFEAYSGLVWVGLVIYFILRRRFQALDWIGLIVLPTSLLLLGVVVMSSAEIRQAPETFKTFWLAVHVLFAKLTYGFNLIGAAFATFYLWKSKRGTTKYGESIRTALFYRLPATKVLEEWSYLCNSTGFVFLTIMIVSGSIWANSAWGSYWSWDPVETWSLVAWLVYGLYLHLRKTMNQRKTVMVTWIGILAFLLTLFALIGLGFLNIGGHSQYLT